MKNENSFLLNKSLGKMRVQLNFEKTKLKKIISLIEWLQEAGMITSFKIDKSEDVEGDFDISDEEADEILQSLAEAEDGDFISHEEVLKNLKNGEI